MKRIVVVGGGFAGFHCLKGLERRIPRGAAELIVVNPRDYHLYTPMLPQVAAGIVHPPEVAIPLSKLTRTKLVLGNAVAVDLDGRTLTLTDPAGGTHEIPWDRLVVTPGSVTRVFDIPGLREHAHGFKTIVEAVYLHDRVLSQVELAPLTTDPALRESLTTFIVVGAGLAGAEYIAQMRGLAASAAPGLPMRWLLLDLSTSVMPQLGGKLSRRALAALSDQGIEVRLGVSINKVMEDSVELTDGTNVPCRLLVWTAGVTASPLVECLGLPTEKGRLVVGSDFVVPGRPDVFALGDAAAVPDLTNQGQVCAQTAQHAMRQGAAAARNVAASLGYGRAAPYRHRDLGMVADLGGMRAVADPFNVPLSGPIAKLVATGYHLLSLESMANRFRTAADLAVNAISRPVPIAFGLVPDSQAAIAAAEQTSIYPPSE